MNFIIQALGGLLTLLLPVFSSIAARWGYKVALVAAVMGIYTSAWVAMIGLLAVARHTLPSVPLTDFALQFFPGKPSISSAASMYLGTMATLKWWDYMRLAFGVAAKIGS